MDKNDNDVDFMCLCALLIALDFKSINPTIADLLKDTRFRERNKIANLNETQKLKIYRAMKLWRFIDLSKKPIK